MVLCERVIGEGGERRCGSGCEERPLEARLGVVSDSGETGEAMI